MDSLDFYVLSGLLLMLGVLASKASGRAGVPALILFLGIGMFLGEEGVGGIRFDNVQATQSLGVVALVFILFSGGLDTNFSSIRQVLRGGILLSTLGVLITSLSVGIFTAWLLPNFTLLEGMLLGAIISSTDAAAVFSILRSRGVHLKGRLKPLLELESGSNDPMAVFLTVGLLQIITQGGEGSLIGLIPMFLQQMVLGAIIGIGAGRATSFAINRSRLEYEGLYPVLTIALVLLTYGLAQTVGGNGFLAVYLAGVFLGKEKFVLRRSLVLFHEGLAWLMQIAMFLTLGFLVYPSQVIQVAGWGIVLSLFLTFVARPLAVHLLLWKSAYTRNEKHMISWVGLRGAVPIILATYPLMGGLPQSPTIFNMVFFIVLTSVLVQGTSIPWIAKILKVEGPSHRRPSGQFDYSLQTTLDNELKEIIATPESAAIGHNIAELKLPTDTLVALIQRSNAIIVPRGTTVIESGDRILVLAPKGKEDLVTDFFTVAPSKKASDEAPSNPT